MTELLGLPKFGPEPRFELRTSEPNLRFEFCSSSGSDLQRRFEFGFSKTASPNTSTLSDWCNYQIDAGYDALSKLPDQPHLGDSQDFLFWGVNVFNVGQPSSPYVGSDVDWVSKPPTGSTCPAGSSFGAGVAITLRNPDGSKTWTPVGKDSPLAKGATSISCHWLLLSA